MKLRLFAVAVPLVLLGCESTTLPSDVREFSPPLLYRQWWAMTESCSERERDIREIQWFASDGQQLRSPDGTDVGGYYTASRNRIVLRGDLRYSGALVRHEMLHAILRNSNGHPREAYLEKCAGTVICLEECTREGGPWPAADATARSGPASLLTIRATSPHDTVVRSDPTSILSATVMATNETGRPLIVTLPPSGDAGPPATFGFAIFTPSVSLFYNERVTNPGSVRFAVGETKRWVADIEASELYPGMAQFYGSFDGIRPARPLNVVVLP
jgi:hypothetical protein